jgi:HEPN domain-containing protein
MFKTQARLYLQTKQLKAREYIIMTDSTSLEALSVFAEATQDLVTAGLEQSLGRHFACADACNQVAEKALQSVSIFRTGHRGSYDHNLQALGESLAAPSEVLEALSGLSPYHPEKYYAHTPPEIADDTVTPEEAGSCIAQARLVQQWARSIVVTGNNS